MVQEGIQEKVRQPAEQKRYRGFTIVELLIVVVVIAILAAISVVSYNGISNRASDTVVMAALDQAQKQIQLESVEGSVWSEPDGNFDQKLQWLNENITPQFKSDHRIGMIVSHRWDYIEHEPWQITKGVSLSALSSSGKVFLATSDTKGAAGISDFDTILADLRYRLADVQRGKDDWCEGDPECRQWHEEEADQLAAQVSQIEAQRQQGKNLWLFEGLEVGDDFIRVGAVTTPALVHNGCNALVGFAYDTNSRSWKILSSGAPC